MQKSTPFFRTHTHAAEPLMNIHLNILFLCVAYFMQQLVKRIVKCSVFLGVHAHDCIVSKASVNVIRIIVSVECVGIAEKLERIKKNIVIFIELTQTQLNSM